LDYINVPPALPPNAFDGDKLKPELAQQGITHYRAIDPEITYTAFNVRDPIVGGFAKEKIALRRALAMAYDVDREVEGLRKRQAVHARMPIPEGGGRPDGDDFIQLLYARNTGQRNNGCYESKAFDQLCEQEEALPNSRERNRLYLLMSQQMEVDTAWSLNVSRLRSELIRPWVLGFK